MYVFVSFEDESDINIFDVLKRQRKVMLMQLTLEVTRN